MSKSHCIVHLVFGLNFLQNMAQRMGQASFSTQEKKKRWVMSTDENYVITIEWERSQDHFIYFPVFRLLHIKWPEFSLSFWESWNKGQIFSVAPKILPIISLLWMNVCPLYCHKKERERESAGFFKQINK